MSQASTKQESYVSIKTKFVVVQVENDFLIGFVDSDYAANKDRRRSLSGFVLTLFDNTISWKSSLQFVVPLSPIESEYMVEQRPSMFVSGAHII